MSFIDESLLDRVAYDFTATGSWATTRYRLKSGRSKRNSERSMPLHRYKAPYKNINPDYAAELIAAHNACGGSRDSFRFKDYSDYLLENEYIGTAVGGVDETMQIVKPYVFGSATLNRIITKPVAGIVVTEDDGVGGGPVTLAHTIDLLTGIITFTSTAGYIIRVTGEYDVPVHFDDDDLDMDYETWNALSAEITLVEDFTA